MNYIFFSLCDNDFGMVLEDAVRFVNENKVCALEEDDWKYWVVLATENFNSMRRIHPMLKRDDARRAQTKAYLENSLKVTFLRTPPEVDHDGGSVVLDFNTGYIWRI